MQSELASLAQELYDIEVLIRKLRDRDRLYTWMMDNAMDAILCARIVETDPLELRIITANRAMERMFDWNPDELYGRPVTTLLARRAHSEHEDRLQRWLKTPLVNQEGEFYRTPGLTKGGSEFEVEISVSPPWRYNSWVAMTMIMRNVAWASRDQE